MTLIHTEVKITNETPANPTTQLEKNPPVNSLNLLDSFKGSSNVLLCKAQLNRKYWKSGYSYYEKSFKKPEGGWSMISLRSDSLPQNQLS